MSILKTFRAYQALSPDQKTFVKEKRIEGWYAPEAWLDFFAKVAEYDRFRDLSSPKVTGLGCGCFALLVVIFFTGIISPLLMITAAAAVIVLAILFYGRRRDVPNHLRLFIVPLLAVLREEVKPNSSLFLRVDLSKATVPEKLVSRELSKSGARLQAAGSTIKEQFFANQWLAARAILADNTVLQLQAIDRVRQRTEGKRRTSGKFKTKTKHKIKTRMEATLRVSNRRYNVATQNLKSSASAKIKVKQGAKRTTVNVRRAAVSDDLAKPASVWELLQAVSTVYAQVAPKGAGGEN